jgi:hypothetical protein
LATGGLVENPKDAKFYNWHLKDPKDKPFVVFKFYYRSWNTLTELHIVSPTRAQQLIPTTPSLVSLAGLSRDAQFHLDEERFREMRISDEPGYGRVIEPGDEQDEPTDESNEEEDEGEDASEELIIEKYDDDFIFSSDIDDRNKHPASVDGSDADKEDNGDGFGEGLSAGEEDKQVMHQDSKPAWNTDAFITSPGRVVTDQGPRVPDPSTDLDPGEGTSDSSKLEQRPPTPYYVSDADEGGNETALIDDSGSGNEISPKKTTFSYLNRPLPPPPVHKSSLRKSFLSKVLSNNKASPSDMSQAQSSSANSSSSEVSLTTSVRAHSGSPITPKLNIARVVKHSGIAKLVDTPPRSMRDSAESIATSRSASPVAASLKPISKFSTLGRAAPSRPPPPVYYYDDDEDYPIGTAISPPSPYSPQNDQNEQTHFTTLPPPVVFDRHNTDPQKKSPRDAFKEVEQQSEQQPGTRLSPITENSTPASTPLADKQAPYPASLIDSYAKSSIRPIRERRIAAQNMSNPGRVAPVNLRIIVPIGEDDESPRNATVERHSEGEYKQRAYVYENPGSEPLHRQPRRVSGFTDLKSTPPKKKEEDGEGSVESKSPAEWLKGA